tara:strand:- start:60 stop:308 length:249 start_codon:yes stop_codon:yes gene_type:complete
VINSSGALTGGRKAFDIAPKLPRNVGKGQVYMTAKNVPPKTINIDGTSIKGPTPPPETIAKTIIPIAPTIPIRDAKSMIIPQ